MLGSRDWRRRAGQADRLRPCSCGSGRAEGLGTPGPPQFGGSHHTACGTRSRRLLHKHCLPHVPYPLTLLPCPAATSLT